ncbi:MAG: DUF1624 domain-containing protein [Acidobacteria bacterium]|nr:DUF1624 domain-containing protein [Acidobacteriota bacterium]
MTRPSAPAPARPPAAALPVADPARTRVVFIDLARAIAVVMMVQGHTIDVLLEAPYRQGAFYDWWLFVRGLTSCMFLTLSGVAFSVTTCRNWAAHLRWSPRVFKRARRFLFFLALAYLVRFPMGKFSHLKWASEERWQSFFVVDILQLVALTLLGLQLLVVLARTPKRFALVSGGLAAAVVVLTPWTWHTDWSELPGWLTAYLNSQTGSLFPVFPWAGYILVGAFIGVVLQRRAIATDPERFIRVAFYLGTASAVAGLVFTGLSPRLYGDIDFWRTSPSAFLYRLGGVVVNLGVVAAIGRYLTRIPRAVQALAEESLTVYIVHVCILYGSLWNRSLLRYVSSQDPIGTLAWIVVLVAAMTALAWTWNACKRLTPRLALVVRLGTVSALVFPLI